MMQARSFATQFIITVQPFLNRISRRLAASASDPGMSIVLGRAPCIHARPRRFVTKSGIQTVTRFAQAALFHCLVQASEIKYAVFP
jgi:hypothetical protein